MICEIYYSRDNNAEQSFEFLIFDRSSKNLQQQE